MSSTPDRNSLRRELRERRRLLAASERIAAANALADHVLSLPFLPDSGYIGGYWAMDAEIGLHALQLRLPTSLIYCLPILHPDQTLRFAPWRAGDPLVTNRFGIPEPDVSPDSALQAAEMSMLVMPLVGFDAEGNRLGMGGGWYDRSLASRKWPEAPLLVGAAFDCQRVDRLNSQAWDVQLDAVCTERATYTIEKPTP